jgi:nitrogen fixation NifU-like protein
MEDLYRAMILERYKTPRFRGRLEPHDIFYEDDNPSCGDHIEITLRLDENQRVADAAFEGHGCAISQASADLLMEYIRGKSLAELKSLTKEDILALLGIQLGPTRLKCALLPLKVLKAGVYGL